MGGCERKGVAGKDKVSGKKEEFSTKARRARKIIGTGRKARKRGKIRKGGLAIKERLQGKKQKKKPEKRGTVSV